MLFFLFLIRTIQGNSAPVVQEKHGDEETCQQPDTSRKKIKVFS